MQCPYCGGQMEWVLPQQAAQLLNVPVQTIRRWCREKRIPGAEHINVRGRRVWRIPVKSLEIILNDYPEELT